MGNDWSKVEAIYSNGYGEVLEELMRGCLEEEIEAELSITREEMYSNGYIEVFEELLRGYLGAENQAQLNIIRQRRNNEERQSAATTSRASTTATSSSCFSTASPVRTSAASSRVVTGSGVPHPFTSAQTSAPHMPSALPLSAMSHIQLQDQRPPQPDIFTQSELERRIWGESLYPDLGGPPSQASQRPAPSNGTSNRDSATASTECIGDYDDLSLSCACCGQRLRTAPIYQCSGGHSSCTECRAAARACGVCTNPVTDMRSFALEVFIAQMKIRCPNAKNGCKRMLTVDKEEAHARECRFGDTPELRCPVDAESFCPWIGKTNMLANHFKQCHSERCGTVGTERTLPGFALDHDHTLVFLLTIGIYHFVLHIEVTGGILRMAVQLVGTTFNANKWMYELHVYNQAEPHRQYFYSDSCSAIGARSPPGAVLACAYAASFLNFNELVYKVYIKKQYKDHISDRKPPINRTRD